MSPSTANLPLKSTRHREKAFWIGLFWGAVAIAATVPPAIFIGFQIVMRVEGMGHDPSEGYRIAAVLAGMVVAGLGIRAALRARQLDDDNYMIEKTTPMPLGMLTEADDAWLDGEIECPHPVIAPEFGTRCAYYHFIERERRSSGKNGTKFVTVANEKNLAPAWIRQGDDRIELDTKNARFDFLPTVTRDVGRRQYVLEYLPAGGRISACGVVVEGQRSYENAAARATESPFDYASNEGLRLGHRLVRKIAAAKLKPARQPAFGRGSQIARTAANSRRAGVLPMFVPYREFADEVGDDANEFDGASPATPAKKHPAKKWKLTAQNNVPVMATPLRRAEWIDRAEAEETKYRVAGVLELFVGASALMWGAGQFAGWFGGQDVGGVLLAMAAGAAVVGPYLLVGLYNRCVAYRVRVGNAWAQIDVDLKMRHDLIPVLAKLVAAYATFETHVLTEVVERRKTATAATLAASILDREAQLTAMARQMTVLAERYPDLKANQGYLNLARQLTALEEKIAHGRHFFNDVVREYNTIIETFPQNLVAAPLGFRSFPYFRAPGA